MRGGDRLLFMGFVFAYMFMFPFAADAERTFPPPYPLPSFQERRGSKVTTDFRNA